MKKIISKLNIKKMISIVLSMALLVFLCSNSFCAANIYNPQNATNIYSPPKVTDVNSPQKMRDLNNLPKETALNVDYPVVDVRGRIVWALDIPTKRWTLSFSGNGSTFSMARNGWYKTYEQVGNILVKDIYFFDGDGLMVTGFIQTSNGDRYYMQETKNANEGKMVYGWQQFVNEKWCFFGEDGVMLKNNYSPEGMFLDGNGQWIMEKSHTKVIGPSVE